MNYPISVIIPVYNGEPYITSALDTLKKQTFQDFEVIFIDDGSTDNSLSILQNAAQINSNISVIHQENQGVSAARNAGIAAASGRFIAFFDVDDLLHPQYLELLYKCIQNDDHAVAIAERNNASADNLITACSSHHLSGDQLLKNFLFGNVSTGVCGMLVPRKLLIDHSLLFSVGRKYSEDLHMVWRIFCFAEKAVFLNAPIYYYLDTPGSAMTKINESRLDSMILIRELEDFFAQERPSFSELFNRFAVARMSWSLLWQAAHYLNFKDFKKYIQIYDFKTDLKKLRTFPDLRVRLSSACFLFSRHLYHLVVSVITKKYRS